MNKTPEEQLEYIVKRVILPKYDFLSYDFIIPNSYADMISFNIYFSSEELPSLEVQSKVLLEVQRLFKMMGLDDRSKITKYRNKVMTWFKDGSMNGYYPSPTTDPRDF